MAGTPQALEGIRVLDLTRLLPGGFCSLLLADLGADVIKVEDCGDGDYMRWMAPYREAGEESTRGSMFLGLNYNKRSVRINLKHEDGRRIFRDMAGRADVILESFRPGVMDRLGVGYEQLREEHPHLVYCAITGYGQDGPLRLRAGHDLNYMAQSGLLALTGEADGPPVQSAAQIADVGGGMMAAIGILAALRARDGTGEGQFVDSAMSDTLLSWTVIHTARELFEGGVRRGDIDLGGRLICYRPYACRDGYVVLGALEAKFWENFCRGVGREELIAEQFAGPGSEAHGEVEAILATRSREEWAAFNDEHDCCLEPVLELDEALESPMVTGRDMLIEIPQPGGTVRRLGVPIKLSGTPADPARLPAPALGEHTADLLAELGLPDEEVARLHESGAVAGIATHAQASYMTREASSA
jgi:alpha-methylacyl-CoA racemase